MIVTRILLITGGNNECWNALVRFGFGKRRERKDHARIGVLP
jgi:hypothetical protein